MHEDVAVALRSDPGLVRDQTRAGCDEPPDSRIQVVDFERTTFKGGADGGADRPAENAFFIRTQVSF